MAITAVVFDVGGVLHTDETRYVRSDILSTLNISDKVFREAADLLLPFLISGKISEPAFWKKLFAITKITYSLPTNSLWSKEFRKRYTINNDVMEIVTSLSGKGMKLAILSNTIASHAKVNQQMGVYDFFPVRILSHEVKLRKPDPKIYQLVLEKLDVKPENSVYIDDMKENTEPAKVIGMHTIVFHNAFQLRKELRKLKIC